jgi:EAL domain-containing protein (putative c-di-GMP-specific phosphodiesterase class I)
MLCLKGCDLLQGYLFSRPAQAHRALSLLQAGTLYASQAWEDALVVAVG